MLWFSFLFFFSSRRRHTRCGRDWSSDVCSSDLGGGAGFGGGAGWWRPPGWFSGPLLANPQFRKVFLARTKDILETIYTAGTFNPILEAMQEHLEPEVKIRAEIFKRDPARAAQSLKDDLDRCREHL